MPNKISDDKSVRETSRLGPSCAQSYRVMVSRTDNFLQIPISRKYPVAKDTAVDDGRTSTV